ncbi:MAG TPA: winged helix-turn-helix domain-containing protein [Aliidongia sp.]|nr:winged helix-turn-helix domain-containing protein [Aliidongia sp.]
MAAAYDRIGQADVDVVEFGPFRLDRARRLLLKDGAPVPLGDRAFEILQVLVGHAPEIVSKATLFEQVWPGVFVEDSTLRYHLWTLRKALGDGESHYISTANGRGYRFAAALSHAPAVISRETNLPLRLTEIIGRERELAELADWLKRSRLVTLAGPGGVGKTRLAVELGWRVLGDFAAGVWLVDLAPLSDENAVAGAVAATLRLSVMKTEATVDAIIAALGKTQLLLILDNCEHLAEAAAALIKTLLERAPGVSILATSQKTFQLAAEHVYDLAPLAVPPPGTIEIGGFAAVELFTRRVRAADRSFALHDGNSVAVGEVCRHLDGLPLALEMAAGRLRLLGVEGLRRGLADRMKLLKGAPDGVARHASLHGMLEWSHNLLAPFDQTVFRRLAAFPAGFSLGAAVAVAGGGEMEYWAVVDALGRLIDQSLVTLERHEPARYRLLETLRLYATDKLREAEEADAVAELHARHFIEVFDEAERCWEETPDPDWIARYQPELDNLRAALDWALAAPERKQIAISLAASACTLLRWLWLIAEGLGYAERIIPLLDADTPAAAAARLLNHAAGFCIMVFDPKGLSFAKRAAALCRYGGDGPGLANALVAAAQFRMWKEQHAEAKDLVLQAQDLLAGSTLKKSRLRQMATAGIVSYRVNDIPNARRYSLAALELARMLRSRSEPGLLTNLGLFEYISGNIDPAIEFTREALSRSNSQLGGSNAGHQLANLASYLFHKEEFSEARSLLTESLSLLVESGNFHIDACLQPWAVLSGIEGRLAEAAQLIGFVDAVHARRGHPVEPGELLLYNRLMGILEAGLPPNELKELKANGAQWSDAEAIEFVTSRLVHAPATGDAVAP